MNFVIKYDQPGRIRLRAGYDAFSETDALNLRRVLEDLPYVFNARTSHKNGGMLIYYRSEYREDLLDFVRDLKRSDIDYLPNETELESLRLNKKFKRDVMKVIGKALFMRFLMPMPIRKFSAIWRFSDYLDAGIMSLLKFNLNVSVLDATSIGVSMLRGDYGTASSIMNLLEISDIMEDYTKKKAVNDFSRGLSVNLERVWIESEDGEEISIPLEDVKLGDRVIVRTGSLIPLDGKIAEGEAYINESSITGEMLSDLKQKNSSVFAGTTVEDGNIVMEVTSLSDESKINKIVNMIEHSESLKANIQNRAEEMADRLVPFSFIGAGLTWLLTRNTMKVLSILLVDYSCALKLTVPISIISAMREASKYKVLVKGGKHLEAFANADTIVFDKTGTLTVATPKVRKVIPFGGMTRDETLRTAACLEEHFPHSVAKAIVKQAEEENLYHREFHADVEYVVAHGIASKIGDKRAVIGSRHFIVDDEKTPISEEDEKIINELGEKYSLIYMAIGGKLSGIICIEDPVRTGAENTIEELRNLGIENIVMLTGDSEKPAKETAEKLGITEYRSQVLPEEKAKYIQELKRQGRTVIMVGDGVNDSPALAASDVSVSMNEGSDIAREVADVILLTPDLNALIMLRELSQELFAKINRNYRDIIGFNSGLIGLGLLGLLPPATSAFLHNASTVAISLRSTFPCLPNSYKTV
ncbi:MAG: heavy metal translocating P-type ATPase [Andreesenia angusta]|nr:heavy metal translocating P-type ATPase [Andreesenia angusta]